MMCAPDRILLCSLQSEQLGIDLLQVAEVLDPCPLHPIPRVPDYFSGVIQVHGLLTAVLDLRRYLGAENPAPGGQLLLVAPDIARLALWVDNADRIVVPAGIASGASADLFPRVARLSSGEDVRLLDVPLLVDRVSMALAGH
jgi:purine-binding chemotaxis protein CheW